MTKKRTHRWTPVAAPLRAVCVGLALSAAALPGMAAGSDAMGIYVQAGHNGANGSDTQTAVVGFTSPWGGERPWAASVFTTYWDVYLGQWRGPQSNGVDKTYTQVGVLSVGRWRYDEGQSPWFTDAGLGLAYLDDLYTQPGGRAFSTRLNFALRLGVGRSFGEGDAHEVSLNYQHFSNAGIKRPNPGLNSLQAGLAVRF